MRTKPITRAQAERVEELLTTVKAGALLRRRTDSEFAEVLEKLLADMDMVSVQYEIIEQAVDRLRRSKLGPIVDAEAKP